MGHPGGEPSDGGQLLRNQELLLSSFQPLIGDLQVVNMVFQSPLILPELLRHQVEGLHELSDFIFGGDIDLLIEVAIPDLARDIHQILNGINDHPRK